MPVLYVVHELYEEDKFVEYGEPSGQPLVAFSTKKKAEEFCRAEWKNYCQKKCPFHYVDEYKTISAATNFEPEILHDWLLEHTGKSPSVKQIKKWDNWEWQGWWVSKTKKLDPGTIRTLWEAFDKVDFFKIQKVELLNG